MLAIAGPGDSVFVPNPAYPIHAFSPIIASADAVQIPIGPDEDYLANIKRALKKGKKPKVILCGYPSNPTSQIAPEGFFEEIIDIGRKKKIAIIHDLAYADLCFDGYKAPSILQIKGAKEVAVEFYSMSKSFSMAGWRVGFCIGNQEMIAALKKIKGYLDYGAFQPLQITAADVLRGDTSCLHEISEVYRKRRDVLCEGMEPYGWSIPKPKGTMFVWARIPKKFAAKGSLAFSKLLLKKALVALSPGAGFGKCGEGFVRFALVESEERIREATERMGKVLDL